MLLSFHFLPGSGSGGCLEPQVYRSLQRSLCCSRVMEKLRVEWGEICSPGSLLPREALRQPTFLCLPDLCIPRAWHRLHVQYLWQGVMNEQAFSSLSFGNVTGGGVAGRKGE